MSRTALRASLALWTRRKHFRARRLKKAQRVGARTRIEHWRRRVDQAQFWIDRRRSQLAHAAPLRVRALNVMLQWERDGVTEQGGNNRGPVVDRIIRKAGGTPGEPWCGDTVAAAYITAGSKTATQSARTFAYVPWIKGLLSRVRFPLPGHVVTYDFQPDGTEDHTGAFVRWVNRAAGDFLAAEGNTGTGGRQSDGQGDGVHTRLRNVHADGARFYRVTS